MDRFLIKVKSLIPRSIFNFFQPFYHWGLAFAGALIYGFPSRSLEVVGVTGTSGKTTTIEFLYEIFSRAGFPSASISTLRFRVAERTELNMLKMTTPGRFKTQRLLREAKNAGVKYVFLEVTSEGIKQYRHKFIKFYAAIFTNLSEEHIEAHGGFENYRQAKGELFKATPIHILNGDDPNFDFFNRIPARKKVVYRMADYPRDLKTQLPGEFNKNNILAALTFARMEGVPEKISFKAIGDVSVMPGRMEFVDPPPPVGGLGGPQGFRATARPSPTADGLGGARPFRVLVDYAFLPQALEKVYGTLNEMGYKRLIAVTGACGGGRDKWKRPHLGDVAAQFCQKVFVTDEDPYDEDPMKIIDEVAGSHKEFIKILDRRGAIREALMAAKSGEGEVVVITGKGAEPWIMGPRGTKVAWDDREVVREELKKI
ncbi:MAG: Mur ligase family protein [Candidatus Colwellbacteria bacterium]|nr:Mur ligase family protein [Candidatus Colwellbacteria bacterium]